MTNPNSLTALPVIMAGGFGTRIHPLTINLPKPMIPLLNRPIIEHIIGLLKRHGISDLVLLLYHQPEVIKKYFGDGSAFGVELVYVVEDSPLGTGGAIRNVASALRSAPSDPVVILNGDILSGHDLRRQLREHLEHDADVTLHLINVEDPRPFGLVPTDASGRVLEFREKPTTPEEIVTNQINAGCYVFKRSVIDDIPAGRVVSVERETFPGLLESGAGVYSFLDNSYWLDLGNPLAFAQGSRDLVRGECPSSLVEHPGEMLVAKQAEVSAAASVTGGSAVAEGALVASGTVVDGSVVMAGARIESGAVVENSIVGAGAVIGANVRLVGVVVADGARVDADNELLVGARVWPNAHIPAQSIRFSTGD